MSFAATYKSNYGAACATAKAHEDNLAAKLLTTSG
jgi:hypothetical protein